MGELASPEDILAAAREVLLGKLDLLAEEVAQRLANRGAASAVPPKAEPSADSAETARLAAELAGLQDSLARTRREAADAEAALQRQRAEQAAAARGLAELEGRRREFEGYRQAGDRSQRLLERLLPDWLRDGTLAAWKARVEQGVGDPAAPPSFGLLFAALHGYTAALPDNDPKTLLDALRDVGKRLYAFLHEDDPGASEADLAHVAEQWARAINRECAGRCEVEVPVPGNAANNQWMFFQPRGGSSPDVLAVRSWCVRDAQRRPVHRAEVVV